MEQRRWEAALQGGSCVTHSIKEQGWWPSWFPWLFAFSPTHLTAPDSASQGRLCFAHWTPACKPCLKAVHGALPAHGPLPSHNSPWCCAHSLYLSCSLAFGGLRTNLDPLWHPISTPVSKLYSSSLKILEPACPQHHLCPVPIISLFLKNIILIEI